MNTAMESSGELPPNPDLTRSIALVRAVQAGDAQALGELFERYRERVQRIVRIRMGAKVRSLLDSSDIVQETWLVAQRNIGRFEPRDQSSIIRWLARIAEHQVSDAAAKANAQKRDRDRELPLVDLDESGVERPLQVEARGPSPSSLVANAELAEIYDACVEELPPEQRELILLREYHDGDWDFVCEALGKPSPHAAQEAYRRAQMKLARLLRLRLR
jgi:RNA polymerase sigma-70 factor (ECF subfamily)